MTAIDGDLTEVVAQLLRHQGGPDLALLQLEERLRGAACAVRTFRHSSEQAAAPLKAAAIRRGSCIASFIPR